jgi:lysophospholipase
MGNLRKKRLDLAQQWMDAGLPRDWKNVNFKTTQDHDIRYAHIPVPEGIEKRGTVVLTTGYDEHIDLYVETVQRYQQMGLEVWAMDWFGQGLSGRENPDDPSEPTTQGLRPHVQDFHDFVTKTVRHDPASGPLILSTQSMGGHIGGLYMEEHPDIFDAAVMGAPMFDIYRVNLPLEARPIIRAIFHMASAVGLAHVSAPRVTTMIEGFTRAAKNVQDALSFDNPRQRWEMTRRELLLDAQIDNPTFSWIRNSFKTTDQLMAEQNLRKIKVPVLIGTAGRDDLVDNAAHARALRHLPYGRQVFLEDSRHGIWFEGDKVYNQWIGHVHEFLDDVVNNYRQKYAAAQNNEVALYASATEAGRYPTLIPIH